MNTTNNTVLITGGTTGIGLAMARALSQLGNRIIITGRNSSRMNTLLRENPSWVGYLFDLAQSEKVGDLAETVHRNHPDLNLLINNAGLQLAIPFPDTAQSPANLRQEMEVNFHAPVHLVQELLPLLLEKREAAIVNVTSALGEVPFSRFPMYSASKAALSAYTTALRTQLMGTSVRVMELVPPLTATDMNAHRPGDKMMPATLANIFIKGLQKNLSVNRAGKAAVLHRLHRIAPSLSSKIIEKGA
ncbi:MAG: SDR family NAD(P)-dependent oxidoreductase [Leptospiraceae bacterium]|nr:SDR family NAD(P)-dependent oxidoreductase [Leptospiraceae bacterium]